MKKCSYVQLTITSHIRWEVPKYLKNIRVDIVLIPTYNIVTSVSHLSHITNDVTMYKKEPRLISAHIIVHATTTMVEREAREKHKEKYVYDRASPIV